MKDPRGRHTLLNEQTGALIIEGLRGGAYFEVACEAAGISRDSGYEWLRRGRAHECPQPVTRPPRKGQKATSAVVVVPECPNAYEHIYVDFAHAVTQVDALTERAVGEGVLRAGAQDWRALAFFLERRHTERWGKKAETRVVGAGGGAVEFVFKVVRDETPVRPVPGGDRKEVA